MYWYHISNDRAFRPRYYLCGMPKSGLHMIEQMVQVVCEPCPGDAIRQADEWNGTYIGNGWTMQPKSARRFCALASRMKPGQYQKGHTGYDAEIEYWLDLAGIATVFVVRDLRDVAVSQVHHILDQEFARYHHPGRDTYRLLPGGFDEVLLAVLEGVGPFPGLVERWAAYAPWLGCEWVHMVRYEDVLADPEDEARKVIGYGLSRVFAPFEFEKGRVRVDEDHLEELVREAVARKANTSASPTFREGKVGGWREAFKAEHHTAFEAAGGLKWLARLGYEE